MMCVIVLRFWSGKRKRFLSKSASIEEMLWAIHDFFETYEAAKTDKDGKLETDTTGKMQNGEEAARQAAF
jgi:hypothetical protein